mmetsp:Transcript_57926/g.159105  ORF Transcript_57926/g.159105 Transcript_57926/m.159105 type:complete len:242 (-) Transcript_57926:197-922(-)
MPSRSTRRLHHRSRRCGTSRPPLRSTAAQQSRTHANLQRRRRFPRLSTPSTALPSPSGCASPSALLLLLVPPQHQHRSAHRLTSSSSRRRQRGWRRALGSRSFPRCRMPPGAGASAHSTQHLKSTPPTWWSTVPHICIRWAPTASSPTPDARAASACTRSTVPLSAWGCSRRSRRQATIQACLCAWPKGSTPTSRITSGTRIIRNGIRLSPPIRTRASASSCAWSSDSQAGLGSRSGGVDA